MTEIREAEEFLNSYLDAEFEEAKAARAESDDVLAQRTAVSETFMHAVPGAIMASVYGRPPMTDEELADYALTVGEVAHRNLFLVAEHPNVAWGPVFAGYISGNHPMSLGAYGLLLYLADIKGQPKIISSYYPDLLSTAVPTVWRHAAGAEFGGLEPPVRVRGIQAPRRAEHHHDWEERRSSAVEP